MKRGYFQFPMIDDRSDAFQLPGTRTTGTAAQTYAITGHALEGNAPACVPECRSPTALVSPPATAHTPQAACRASKASLTKSRPAMDHQGRREGLHDAEACRTPSTPPKF
ncbi:DUF1254 domain-containing protein [Xanthobacter versatilis]|uniref:DUF1254 domain-containing protein n=1 Tax=Xanthobacter autotrophicus (strain ATCC BAA-1158 / Py2) TaxID=78245 RepID=UPI003728D349